MKISKGITEGFRRASFVIGIIFGLAGFIIGLPSESIFYSLGFSILGYLIGLWVTRLVGWILSGFFNF